MKITDPALTAQTALGLASNDLIMTTDVSDVGGGVGGGAAGKSKPIEVENLFYGRTMTLIQEISHASADEFEFLAIPQDFKRLFLYGWLRATNAVVDATAYIYFNGLFTNTDYSLQRRGATNGTANASEGNLPEFGLVPGASALANSYADFEARINGYTEANKIKCCSSAWDYLNAISAGNQVAWSGRSATFHRTLTAAITQINIRSSVQSLPATGLIGKLALYGEN